MPSRAYYLKERYQLPEAVIDDVRLFLHFVQTKYQKEIDQCQSLHREYWEEQCDWVISFTQKSRSYNLSKLAYIHNQPTLKIINYLHG